jgi:hypothetical protein
MMHATKTAALLLDSLPTWQKLNVTAFLGTGIGNASQDAMGEIYRDGAGHEYTRLFEQPIVVLAAPIDILQRAIRISREQRLACCAYVTALFAQTNGVDGRQVFKEEPVDAPDLVGLAIRGERKAVDKAAKGARLHS